MPKHVAQALKVPFYTYCQWSAAYLKRAAASVNSEEACQSGALPTGTTPASRCTRCRCLRWYSATRLRCRAASASVARFAACAAEATTSSLAAATAAVAAVASAAVATGSRSRTSTSRSLAQSPAALGVQDRGDRSCGGEDRILASAGAPAAATGIAAATSIAAAAGSAAAGPTQAGTCGGRASSLDGRNRVSGDRDLPVDGRWTQTGTLGSRTIPVDGRLERVTGRLGDDHAALAPAECLDFSWLPPLLLLSRS